MRKCYSFHLFQPRSASLAGQGKRTFREIKSSFDCGLALDEQSSAGVKMSVPLIETAQVELCEKTTKKIASKCITSELGFSALTNNA